MSGSMPTNTSSFQTQYATSVNEMDPKLWALLYGNPNATGRLQLEDASNRAQILRGVQRGDKNALAAFYGRTPQASDLLQYQAYNPQKYGLKGPNYSGIPSMADALFLKPTGYDPFYGTARTELSPKKTRVAKYIPKKSSGGLMTLRKMATGGATAPVLKPGPVGETAEARAKRLMDYSNAGGKLTADQKGFLSTYNTYAAKAKAGGYTLDHLTGKPIVPEPPVGSTPEQQQAWYQKWSDTFGIPLDAKGKPLWNQSPTAPAPAPPPGPTIDNYGGITNPFYQKAIDVLKGTTMPGEYGQAADIYRQAASGLGALTSYKPSDVQSQNITMERVAAESAAAAQMAAVDPVQAAQMAQVADVHAQKLKQYQMNGGAIPKVSNKELTAFQMAGPGSWTEEGVQQKYMNPYMQGVVDIAKREKTKDYQNQINMLNAKAMGAGAYGGAGAALERSQAGKNYQQQMQDLQTQGMSQAYQQGMQQWGTETGLGQQAAIQNLQSKLGTQAQMSQEQLQAALANQGIDYNTAVQNLQAKLGVQQQEAANMLQAALANQQAGLLTGQTNAQLGQQANLANQQMQYNVGALNAQNQQQSNIANMQAALQASMANQQTNYQTGAANQQAALQAALANQQAGLQGAQLNLGAYNAQGNMAAGLGNIGQLIQGYNQNQFQNWGQAGGTWQDIVSQYNQQQQNNANNFWGGIGGILGPVNSGIAGHGWGGTTTNTGGTRPSSPFG